MCLSQSEQIEKFIENGMPTKIVKTVEYTMRKRAKEHQKEGTAQALPDIVSTVTEDLVKLTMPTLNLDKPIDQTAAAHLNAETQSNAKAYENLKIPKLCGRFRQQQQQQQKKQHLATSARTSGIQNLIEGRSPSNAEHSGYMDALAVATQLTKRFTQQVSNLVHKMQTTTLYTVLTRTTQPAHVLAIAVFTLIVFTIWPKLIQDTGKGGVQLEHANSLGHKDSKEKPSCSTLAVIAYLAAFAIHFGAQIWMTFVSGLSLYFSLPRHTFGQCQQILFPKYFALNAMLSMCMLVLFVRNFLSSWTMANSVQLIALIASTVIETTIRLYLAPPMLRLMHEKYKIEDAIGSGREVGTLVQGDLAQCPHYQRIHKAFRRKHMLIAMGNMAVLLATCLHLYFLALKIHIH